MTRKIAQVFSTAAMLLLGVALNVFADTDIEQHRNCGQCGMDRKAYGYSRMLVEYANGRSVGLCSLHCVVTELNSGGNGKVSSVKAADRTTRQLIDAEKAVWVIGGKKRGVMTMRAKWAFAARESAEAFVIAYGGMIVPWNGALAAAEEDAAPKKR